MKAPERNDPREYAALHRLHDAVASGLKDHVSEHAIKYPWSSDPFREKKDADDLAKRFMAGKIPATLMLKPDFKAGELHVLARLPGDAISVATFKLKKTARPDPEIHFSIFYVPGYEKIGLEKMAGALRDKTLIELVGSATEPILSKPALEKLRKKDDPFLSVVGKAIDHARLENEPEYVRVPHGKQSTIIVTRRYYDTKQIKEKTEKEDSISVAFTAFEDSQGKLHEMDKAAGHDAVNSNFISEVNGKGVNPKDLLRFRTHFAGGEQHVIEVYSQEGMRVAEALQNIMEHVRPTHEVTIELRFPEKKA
jgi:hypothetical protein